MPTRTGAPRPSGIIASAIRRSPIAWSIRSRRRNSASPSAARSRADYAEITCGDGSTNETRILPTADFTAEPVLISPREEPALRPRRARGHSLHPRQRHPRQFPRRYRDGLLARRLDRTDRGLRPPLHPGCHDFRNLIVIEERIDGLSQIRLRDYDTGAERYIAFPEASYVAGLGSNPEYRGRPASPLLSVDGDARHGLRLSPGRRPAGSR